MLKGLIRAAAVGTLALAATVAAADDLDIGKKAPALTIENWVQGDAITGFEKGQVYVVEFWATWCGPCLQSIPHLNEMHNTYKGKGVHFIGVTKEDPNNKIKKVTKFVKDWEGRMEYTVAFDKGDTYGDYMTATGQTGIPTAFVIDQNSKLAWIGHPMGGLEKVVELVNTGTYDIERYKKGRPLEKKINASLRSRDYDSALKTIDEIIVIYPELFSSHAGTKIQVLMRLDRFGEAQDYAKMAAHKYLWDDAMTLNQISWDIATHEGDEARDLDLALELAVRASELTHHTDSMVLDSVGRVYFERGEFANAIKWQALAVKNADEDDKGQFERTLDQFRAEADGG